jgi:hypothetical protein
MTNFFFNIITNFVQSCIYLSGGINKYNLSNDTKMYPQESHVSGVDNT